MLAWGIALLGWLTFEDSDTRLVLAFALAGSSLATLRFMPPKRENTIHPGRAEAIPPVRRSLGRYLLAGALAGLAAGPLAVLLMAVKSGLHAHPVPDYSGEQVIAVLVGAPSWIAAGILLGLGTWLFEAARRPR